MAAVLFSLYALFAPAGGGEQPFEHSDKVLHFLIFATLAGTTRWRFGPSLLHLAVVAAYAIGSEIIQGAFLSTRSGDPWDALADLAGAVAGWLLAGRLTRP